MRRGQPSDKPPGIHGGCRTLCQCLLILLLCHVQVVHVCGVVLAVVQLHDLSTDVGLQGSIVVGEVRQRVLVPSKPAQAGCTPGNEADLHV